MERSGAWLEVGGSPARCDKFAHRVRFFFNHDVELLIHVYFFGYYCRLLLLLPASSRVLPGMCAYPGRRTPSPEQAHRISLDLWYYETDYEDKTDSDEF